MCSACNKVDEEYNVDTVKYSDRCNQITFVHVVPDVQVTSFASMIPVRKIALEHPFDADGDEICKCTVVRSECDFGY